MEWPLVRQSLQGPRGKRKVHRMSMDGRLLFFFSATFDFFSRSRRPRSGLSLPCTSKRAQSSDADAPFCRHHLLLVLWGGGGCCVACGRIAALQSRGLQCVLAAPSGSIFRALVHVVVHLVELPSSLPLRSRGVPPPLSER